jgi:hypothetical protein
MSNAANAHVHPPRTGLGMSKAADEHVHPPRPRTGMSTAAAGHVLSPGRTTGMSTKSGHRQRPGPSGVRSQFNSGPPTAINLVQK